MTSAYYVITYWQKEGAIGQSNGGIGFTSRNFASFNVLSFEIKGVAAFLHTHPANEGDRYA